jgi:hypothetical protein
MCTSPGNLKSLNCLTCVVIFLKGVRNVMVKKFIILCYSYWSKELGEGESKCLQMEWNLLFLLTCFVYYFLGVLFQVLLLKVVLAVASVDGQEVRALPR